MTTRCLVIGVGKMGVAHLQALAALSTEALAGWAPSERRRQTVEALGAQFFNGSLEAALKIFLPTHVIVASPVETLIPISLKVIAAGVHHILVEKPVTLSGTEGALLRAAVEAHCVHLHVGYNRRFYSSIRTALRMIADAGEEIESITFEFNEAFPDLSGPINHAQVVRERWLLANSLHVIDSAMFPVGLPDPSLSAFVCHGRLAWHPAGSVFVGSGLTVSGKPFVYHANWAGPGRWGFEWLTPSARYVFRPLEKLSVMRRGSFSLEDIQLDDDLDRRFKPGVYLQNQAFLSGNEAAGLVSLDHALSLVLLGEAMARYGSEESRVGFYDKQTKIP
jgi:predicted dehydrogenase